MTRHVFPSGIGLLLAAMGIFFCQPLQAEPAADRLLTGADRDALIDSLEARWNGYRSEVATAHFDYLSLVFRCTRAPLGLREFEAAMERIDFHADDVALRLLEQFCPDRLEGSPEEIDKVLAAVTDQRSFYQRGRTLRSHSPVFSHIMTGDLHMLVDHANEDVKAYRRGTCPYFVQTLEWFRRVPERAMVTDGSAVLVREEDVVLFPTADANLLGSWISLDREDGLPRRWQLVSKSGTSPNRVEYFRDYATFPGNVLLPSVRIHVNLAKGQVGLVQVTILKQAQVNSDLMDDTFRLSAPRGWAWFDWRTSDRQGGRWSEPVGDVAEFFQRRIAESSPASPPVQSSNWKSILLIVNGTVLIAIGLLLWRRNPAGDRISPEEPSELEARSSRE